MLSEDRAERGGEDIGDLADLSEPRIVGVAGGASRDVTLSCSPRVFFRSRFVPTRMLNVLPNFCVSESGRVGDDGCVVGVDGTRVSMDAFKGAGAGAGADRREAV